MEIPVNNLQTIKLAVHITQAVAIVVAWCIEIPVLTSSATIDGRPGWYFGLCFLTVPAIIYLTMTQRFPRTRKFANPFALASVDVIFTILWLSAFAAVASWNSAGKCGNACHLSKAVVALGVFTWIFFIVTSAISIYGVIYFRREGYLPGASRAPRDADTIDPDKDAFSTAPQDEYAPVQNDDDNDMHDVSGYGGDVTLPRYGSPSYGGGYVPPQAHDESTAYSGYSGEGRAQFPAGRYDNV